MNYSHITDQVFEILNETIIPEVYKSAAEDAAEIALNPEANKTPEVQLLRKEILTKIVCGCCQKKLPVILPEAALWFKGTGKPAASHTWLISPYEYNIMGQEVVSIALAENDRLVIGIFANFTAGEVITGVMGEGAQLDERTFAVSRKELSSQSTVMQFLIPPATIYGAYTTKMAAIKRSYNFPTVVNKVAENIGYYLTLLARGEVDLVMAKGFQYHDIAAALCIAEQAGAVACDFAGGKQGIYNGDILICSNPIIQEQLRNIN